MFIPVVFAIIAAASAVCAATSPAHAGPADPFTVTGIKVDATARTPREASNVAMAQGRSLAWSELFRRFTLRTAWSSQPQLTDNQLLGLILSAQAVNERHNTTRYLADVNFHFNPEMVRQLLRTSHIVSVEGLTESALLIPISIVDDGARTRLTADVRFNSLEDWVGLRERLAAVNAITKMEVVGLTWREARIELTYFGQAEQFLAALAQQDLELGYSGGMYTLEHGIVTAANLP